jgi:hypothetical protein
MVLVPGRWRERFLAAELLISFGSDTVSILLWSKPWRELWKVVAQGGLVPFREAELGAKPRLPQALATTKIETATSCGGKFRLERRLNNVLTCS